MKVVSFLNHQRAPILRRLSKGTYLTGRHSNAPHISHLARTGSSFSGFALAVEKSLSGFRPRSIDVINPTCVEARILCHKGRTEQHFIKPGLGEDFLRYPG